MTSYELIDVDQMEATKLRRMLEEPWSSQKSNRAKPVIAEIAKTCEGGITPTEPRWEHGVYPLYYKYKHDSHDNFRTICNRILEKYDSHFPELKDKYPAEQLTAFVEDLANTEILTRSLPNQKALSIYGV